MAGGYFLLRLLAAYLAATTTAVPTTTSIATIPSVVPIHRVESQLPSAAASTRVRLERQAVGITSLRHGAVDIRRRSSGPDDSCSQSTMNAPISAAAHRPMIAVIAQPSRLDSRELVWSPITVGLLPIRVIIAIRGGAATPLRTAA